MTNQLSLHKMSNLNSLCLIYLPKLIGKLRIFVIKRKQLIGLQSSLILFFYGYL